MLSENIFLGPMRIVATLLSLKVVDSFSLFCRQPKKLPEPDTPNPPLNYKRTADSGRYCETCKNVGTPAGFHPCVKACYTSSRKPNWTPRESSKVSECMECEFKDPLTRELPGVKCTDDCIAHNRRISDPPRAEPENV